MTQTEFHLIFEQQVKRCEETLLNKAKEYTGNSPDRLSAFKTAAALQECTPERALAGMMAKHTVSVYDMCNGNEEYSLEKWNEKIVDHINYLLILRAMVVMNI